MKNGSHAEPLEYAYALEVSHLINRNCAAACESAWHGITHICDKILMARSTLMFFSSAVHPFNFGFNVSLCILFVPTCQFIQLL